MRYNPAEYREEFASFDLLKSYALPWKRIAGHRMGRSETRIFRSSGGYCVSTSLSRLVVSVWSAGDLATS